MRDIKKIVGKNLKAIRKKQGLTQDELAYKLNKRIERIERIESGKAFISSDLILEICEMFNITPPMLFDSNTYKMIENSSRNKELLRQLRSNIKEISADTAKLEFLDFIIDALDSDETLKKLKYLLTRIDSKNVFNK